MKEKLKQIDIKTTQIQTLKNLFDNVDPYTIAIGVKKHIVTHNIHHDPFTS